MMEHHVIGVDLSDFEDGLSPEERAAIEDGEQAKTPDEPTREELEEMLADGSAETEGGERRPFVSLMEVKPVEDYDARLEEIDDQKAEVRRQRAEGDLDFDEAEIQLEALADRRMDLVRQQEGAVRAAQHNAAAGMAEWQFEVRAFLRGHGEYEDDQVLWDALDSTVKRLANEQDAQGTFVNADRDARWFLNEAHRRVAALARPGHRDDADDVELQDRGRADGSRQSFRDIDRLTGLELERVLGGMSEQEAAAYLRGE